MNILIDLVPTTIEVLGEEYKINSDFRTSILFELLIQDKELTDEEKITQALILYYEDNIPKDINKAIEGLLWFYRGGKEEAKATGKGKGKGNNKQIYSYEYDAELIYSAFMSQYGIDLQDIKYLHWFKFKALFKGLKEDNEICKAMKYRSMDLNTIKDKEERKYYKKMKELYKIPISEDEQAKLDEITEALLKGEDVNKLL